MKENLFILIGPTAIGKTDLSIDLAKKLNGEIISADSMQIYKYMDIGTAKIRKNEMDNIPHYLIDMIYPDEEYTVADYQRDATKLVTDINLRNKLPIVVGGTGLYINSLVYNLNFTKSPPNDEYRLELEKLADIYGDSYLHEKLAEVDFESSKSISKNDRKRIIRALEVYEVTGKTMSEHNKDFRREIDKYSLTMICLNMDRKKLYDRINRRVDIMIENGLIDEVNNILNMGYSKDLVSLKGIGYKEIIMYLEGDVSLDTAIEKIKQGSRNYAKRQLTWFRRDKRIKWIDKDDFGSFDDLSNYVYNYVNRCSQ
ncbi:MAG: tRNA (adenosine(37)-N6)-dimethylallyltransferase MiaA [Tissierellaceae bacterium]|nr:tRNA (adenosine(37)-N6)-dimethylallyltransferase MiaA [Tissierellaceae bacterium]